MHGDGRPSRSLGFLALDRHRGAVGSGPNPWVPPAPGPVPYSLRPVGPRRLPRTRLNSGAWRAGSQPRRRPLHRLTCGNVGARARLIFAAASRSLGPELDPPRSAATRLRPAGASRASSERPGSSGLRPVGAVGMCRGGLGGVWGSAEEMSESAELRVCAL